ncbi:MAG: glycosyltransferase family 2 protein [Cyanobacteria bacterium]|nr:glycosyltransferase family 2 protein [Cyanobacteriota bacterium]
MSQSPSLSIVIPCLNEEGAIAGVVRESMTVLSSMTDVYDVVVIDDASTDNTQRELSALLSEYPEHLKVITNPKTIGCHPSSLIGFRAAKGDYRLFIPGDHQIPAAEFPKFLAEALKGADVVYSWRVHRADPFHRRLISGLYNLVVRTCLGIRLHDVDSASMLSAKAVETLLPHVTAENAFITVDMLIQSKKLAITVGEAVIDHHPRRTGEAKGLNLKDLSKVPGSFLKMLWWVWTRR